MRNKILLGAMIAGLFGLVYAFTAAPPTAEAQRRGQNLQVLPKNMTVKEIRKVMRGMADALDVDCDFCHDMDDMSKDSDKKKIAREMMRMTNEINNRHLKGSSKKVTCMTCHRGKAEPDK